MDHYDLYFEAQAISDVGKREAFLQRHCGNNPMLLKKLQDMLQVRAKADRLLEVERPDIAGQGWEDVGPPGSVPLGLGRVGRFRLERLVGRGGMGNVFLAYDEQLERPVALKFPRLDSMVEPQLMERFLREAKLAAQLSHPNLVDIYEVGVWGEACFIASQWCEGGDLAHWLVQHPGPQDPNWSVRLVRDITRAVAYCHQQSIVHLDIKPANIILAPDTQPRDNTGSQNLRPKLTDFGVARIIKEGSAATHTSLLLGTPLYMAPEQAACAQSQIGPASDIFALGVVLHELIFGERPFDGNSPIEVLDRLRQADTLVIRNQQRVPRALVTICERCLQLKPEDRYPSADALAEDLDRYLRGEPIHSRPVTRWDRIWRWLERPERISQAGVIGLTVQLFYVFDYAIVLAAAGMGWADSLSSLNVRELAEDLLFLVVLFDIPVIYVVVQSIYQRAWSVPVGAIASLATMAVLLHAVITVESTLQMYKGQPFALFLYHSITLIAIGIQATAYLLALPAARRKRRGERSRSTRSVVPT